MLAWLQSRLIDLDEIGRLGALARSSVSCCNIIPRTFFCVSSRLVTVQCPSERVPGESASDPCLKLVFFGDRRYTMVAWCSLFMFCLLGSVGPREAASELESLEAA